MPNSTTRSDVPRFRSGTRVDATDGSFGTLSDVVVDPNDDAISHIVVSRPGDHHQQRLVPLWLVAPRDDTLRINLDLAHAQQLQRLMPGEFARRSSEPRVNSYGTWDLRTALVQPFYRDPAAEPDDRAGLPRSQCEIRRKSSVVSCNDRLLGSVEGLLTVPGDDEPLVTSVIVRSGLPGFRNDVVVPLELVVDVHGDMIGLSIDRDAFRSMPATYVAPARDDHLSPIDRVHHGAGRARSLMKDWVDSRRTRNDPQSRK